MRLKFIACKAIQREAYYCASQAANIVDVIVMPQGLHNEPDTLRSTVQTEVDRILDMCRTTTNVTGDLVTSTIVARFAGVKGGTSIV